VPDEQRLDLAGQEPDAVEDVRPVGGEQVPDPVGLDLLLGRGDRRVAEHRREQHRLGGTAGGGHPVPGGEGERRFLAGEHVMGVADARVVTLHRPGLQHPLGFGGRGDHLIRLRRGCGQRLFHQGVLARAERVEHQGVMKAVRHGDDHRIDVVAGQQFPGVGNRMLDPVAAGYSVQDRAAGVGHRRQLHLVRLLDRGKVSGLGDSSGTDDSETDRGSHFQ
jgi:hypothetical protein